MGVKTLHTWDRVGGGDNDTAKFEMREGGCVPPHPFPPTLCKLLHRGSTGGKRLGRFLGLILIQNYFFGDGGGWVGEGKKFFFYLCHKFCCCCSGVCVACSSRSTWKSFAFGNSLWEELLLGTHFSPLTHHLEILTTISFEMGTRNQCDQMVRLFLNIWSFATMKIRAKN